MDVIVDKHNLSQCLDAIASSQFLGVDTETTGLMPFHEDNLFSVIVSTLEQNFYLNFLKEKDHLGNRSPVILNREIIPSLIPQKYDGRIFLANAVFDINFLLKDNLDLRNYRIYDVQFLARLVNNDRFSVQLGTLAKDIGMDKLDIIDEYCKDNKLIERIKIPGKKTDDKKKLFAKVPFEYLSEYGCRDGKVTVNLGVNYFNQIIKMNQSHPMPEGLGPIVDIERRLIPVLSRMSQVGIQVDVEYCEKAAKYYNEEADKIALRYKELTGNDFVDSNKCHSDSFKKLGLKYPLTEKGNPSFNKEALENMDTEISKLILKYRALSKKASFLWSYTYFADRDNIIHTSIKQASTRTGRFSSSTPNLQQVPKRGEDKYEYPVRRAFKPREGYVFFALDFDQFEYRMMLNEAGELGVINQVLDGLDVHTATMNMMGTDDRAKAKTINFLLLYGGGLAVLAMMLYKTPLPEYLLKKIQKMHFKDQTSMDNIKRITQLSKGEIQHSIDILSKARDDKQLYYSKLQKVKKYVNDIIREAETGKMYNCFGRCYRFKKNLAYKAPNYRIQGGTADWIKKAMVNIDDYLQANGFRSRMLLQVHDELLFEIHESEITTVVPIIKELMETVAPTAHLPYTVGVDYSRESWFDKKTIEDLSKLSEI